MIGVQILVEFPADESGPAAVYSEDLILPTSFARDASEAHARLLTLIASEDYFELPREGKPGPMRLNSSTVRQVVVWWVIEEHSA